MADKSITGAPKEKVSISAVSRNNAKFSVTFKVPANAKSGSNEKRFESLQYRVTYDLASPKKDSVGGWQNLSLSKTSATVTADLTKYYPTKKSAFLSAVKFEVRGKNAKGEGTAVSKSFKVSKPKKPEVSVGFNEETGIASAVFKGNGGDDGRSNRMRGKTIASVLWQKYSGSELVEESKSSNEWTDANQHTLTHDFTAAGVLGDDEYLRCYATASNKGAGGDSGTVKKELLVGRPSVPKLGEPTVTGSGVNARAIFGIEIGTDKKHPTHTVQLQRAMNINSSVTSSEEIEEAAWADVEGAVDNGDCEGLSDLLANAESDNGTFTWYRVKASAYGYSTYSDGRRLDATYREAPTAADDHATINSISNEDDGTTVKVSFSHEVDDSTGTELSWSDFYNAWESNEEPKTFEVEGGGVEAAGVVSNSVFITGLDEGVTYYFRARRYLEGDGGRNYGDYSARVAVVPTSTPADLSMMLPEYVVAGDGIPVAWSFAGEATQVAYKVEATVGEAVRNFMQETSNMGCIIPADAYGNAEGVTAKVYVTTGGGWAESAIESVKIVKAPTCSIAVTMPAATPDDSSWWDAERQNLANPDTVLPAQGATVHVSSNDPSAYAVVRVVADGCSIVSPAGDVLQAAGDVVWSGYTDALGTEGQTVELPDDMELYDRCSYKVEAQAIDVQTELASDKVAKGFSVLWAHQAAEPIATATVAGGVASVEVTAPAGAKDTDVCDVYRLSADMPYLIASGIQFGSTVADQYPPYTATGEAMAYRVATRTADGDFEYTDDVEYSYRRNDLCIDWNGAGGSYSLSVPYSLSFTPSTGKDFEARTHLDGSVSGYWGKGVSMTVPISANVLANDAEKREALFMLGHHNGACMVRLPNGMAFPANVEVSGMEYGAGSGLAGISLDVTRVGMSDEFTAVQ